MTGKGKMLVLTLLLLAAIVVSERLGWLSGVQEFVRTGAFRVSKPLYENGLQEEDLPFDSTEELRNAYLEIERKLIAAQIDASRFSMLQSEVDELRKQLDFVEENDFIHLGTSVIGRTIDPVGGLLIIDAGKDRELQSGDPVVAGEGILVGLIDEVFDTSATVRLVNDTQSTIAGTLANREESAGLIQGKHGISIDMTLIPQHEVVSVGDMVLTSGLEENIPRGLAVGKVETLEKEPFQPFQRAQVKSLVSLDKLRLLTVLHSVGHEEQDTEL